MKSRCRFRLTREGLRFLVLLGIVSFAAYNTKNNLLYLMLSVGIASACVCLAGGIWSLRRVSIAGTELPDVYAGVAFHEKVRLRNSSRVLDAFGLQIDSDAASVPCLRKGSQEFCRVGRLYRRRGLYEGDALVLSTRFPFGFLRFSRTLAAPRKVLVFPRIRPINDVLLAANSGGATPRAQHRGQGDELFRLRDYVPGDHVHHIHWKTSAKLGEMIVREFGNDEDERLTVAFSSVISDGRDPAEFEVLVSAAASVVSHLAASGSTFSFLTEGLELPSRSGRNHAREILSFLAQVSARARVDSGFATRVARASQAGETVLLVAFEECGAPGCRLLEPERLFA